MKDLTPRAFIDARFDDELACLVDEAPLLAIRADGGKTIAELMAGNEVRRNSSSAPADITDLGLTSSRAHRESSHPVVKIGHVIKRWCDEHFPIDVYEAHFPLVYDHQSQPLPESESPAISRLDDHLSGPVDVAPLSMWLVFFERAGEVAKVFIRGLDNGRDRKARDKDKRTETRDGPYSSDPAGTCPFSIPYFFVLRSRIVYLLSCMRPLAAQALGSLKQGSNSKHAIPF